MATANRSPDESCVDAPRSSVLASGLLTVDRSSELCSMSRSFLYSQMDKGNLPYIKLGRSRRIAVSDLEEFVASRKTGGWAIEGTETANSVGQKGGEHGGDSALAQRIAGSKD